MGTAFLKCGGWVSQIGFLLAVLPIGTGRTVKVLGATIIIVFGLLGASALAADIPAPVKAAPQAPAPASWWDAVKFSGYLDGGITFNPSDPSNGINFGHLFTDKANEPLLNQFVLTLERPLDPKATGYDFGFKFQGMYGSDARYTHFLGEFDKAITDRSQIDIVEANALVHLPWLTAGGIDVKMGQFVTLEGAETIDPRTNLLYSHTYIFNFGIPFKHTGVVATAHANSVVDIMGGITTGVNTTIGCCMGDNNHAPAFHGGFGLNLLNGALTVSATTHIGPENADEPAVRAACECDPNRALRYLNDITITWKVNDKLSLITDLNYIRDDGFHASGGGVAQYIAYKIDDVFKIVGRAEIWADPNAFFVNAFPGNLDFVNSELGLPATVISGGKTTYGALTLGLNITPSVPKTFEGLTIRPEIRYDTSLNGTAPFADGTKSSQLTFGGDIVVPFSML
jgi:Putative beta-barrel porin-2, OmpL-like. bbp2